MDAISEVTQVDAAADGARQRWHRARRTPLTWVRSGGLTTLLFMLPTARSSSGRSRGTRSSARWSWRSSTRTSCEAPTWVGLDNFRAVLDDPLLPIAVKNTAYFALLALVFGYPIPLAAAVLMSEVRPRRGRLQRARLPAGRDPAGRRGPALEDVLRRRARPASSTRARLGRPRAVPVAPVGRRGRCRRSCSRRPGRTPARR